MQGARQQDGRALREIRHPGCANLSFPTALPRNTFDAARLRTAALVDPSLDVLAKVLMPGRGT